MDTQACNTKSEPNVFLEFTALNGTKQCVVLTERNEVVIAEVIEAPKKNVPPAEPEEVFVA